MANIFSDVLIAKNNGDVVDAGNTLGVNKTSVGIVTLTANPAQNDVLMFLDLPSNAKLSSLRHFNDSMGTAATNSFGIYAAQQFKDASGTVFKENDVIDIKAFVDNQPLMAQQILVQAIESLYDPTGTLNTPANSQFELWELAGLAEDPEVNLRIGWNIDTIFTGFQTGSIVVYVHHTGK